MRHFGFFKQCDGLTLFLVFMIGEDTKAIISEKKALCRAAKETTTIIMIIVVMIVDIEGSGWPQRWPWPPEEQLLSGDIKEGAMALRKRLLSRKLSLRGIV